VQTGEFDLSTSLGASLGSAFWVAYCDDTTKSCVLLAGGELAQHSMGRVAHSVAPQMPRPPRALARFSVVTEAPSRSHTGEETTNMQTNGWVAIGLGLMMSLGACTVDDESMEFRGGYDSSKHDDDGGHEDTGEHGDTGKHEDTGDEHDGCVRTMGYWRNHSALATNPNQQIPWPISETTQLCGASWWTWLRTPPVGGNAWIILARQWIVAQLNDASSADVPQHIAEAMTAAEALLADCVITDAERAQAIELAELLDAYNNGLEGVDSCD
jgi:hypothetical protein